MGDLQHFYAKIITLLSQGKENPNKRSGLRGLIVVEALSQTTYRFIAVPCKFQGIDKLTLKSVQPCKNPRMARIILEKD